MTIRKSLAVLIPAAALFAFTGASVAYGQEIPTSMRAAELNAGTAATGIGPDGQVGSGIQGAVTEIEVAGIQVQPSGFLSYVQRLRYWSSAGFRIQPGHLQLFSMQRQQLSLAEGDVEVAGVQVGDVDADGATSYEEGLRRFTSDGYRIQPGYVSTSALVRS